MRPPTHSWAPEPRLRANAIERLRMKRTVFALDFARKHCVKCGATLATHMRPYPGPRVTYFTALGARHRHVRHIPPCEGLPPWYDPPIGS